MVWIEEELPARIGLAVLSNAKILFDREKLMQVKPGAMLPAFLHRSTFGDLAQVVRARNS